MLSGVTPSVVLEGFSVDILKLLHFLEKLCVPLTTLAQIPMKQPQSWVIQGTQWSHLKCWVEHMGTWERRKDSVTTAFTTRPLETGNT